MDSSSQIDIQVDDDYASEVDLAGVETAAQRALATAGVKIPVELSLLITSDTTLHELNRQYRDQDKVTDVLSFPQQDLTPTELVELAGLPPLEPGQPSLLGDVVIAYPRVVAQAAQAGWATSDELAWLVIHGVLHLLGYDDEDEDGRAEMWALGEQALGKPAPEIRE